MFLDYMTRYTDSPFLVEINEVGEGAHEGIAPTTLVPGKFLTAAKMPAGTTTRTENNEFRPLVIEADGTVKDPGGTLADRFGEEGAGHWNLNLDGVEPVMSIMDTNEWEPERSPCRASTCRQPTVRPRSAAATSCVASPRAASTVAS